MDNRLFNISQIRVLEKNAYLALGIDDFELMSRAGAAAFSQLQHHWPQMKKIIVCCGPGNNGGDGYVLAHLAKGKGYEVTVRTVGDVSGLADAAAKAFNACLEANIDINPFRVAEDLRGDVIIDAIFGIGLKTAIGGFFQEAVNAINNIGLPVLAIDVPTGINADTGATMGCAVRATVTVTFIGLKQGLFTNDAIDYCGKVVLASLDLPESFLSTVSCNAKRLTQNILKQLQPRPKNSQKGNYGHVVIVGGNEGMAGAVRLAAEAALRVGAGLVTVATWPSHQAIVLAHYPELMCVGITEVKQLLTLIEKATVIVIGPGLGQDQWARSLLETALANQLPKVIDADALNLLGTMPRCKDNWILTPHPGEAARLLKMPSSVDIQQDRFGALHQLSLLGGMWVLKGAGTLIGSHGAKISLCPYGNPGMASGGMGDALSGIIGGLLAQRLSLHEATTLGVVIHALAGDKAAKEGERGLVATDLIAAIRNYANQ